MKTINDFLTPEELEMATPKEALKKELEATRLKAKNKPKAIATNSVSRINSTTSRSDVKPQRKSRATTSKGRAPITDVWPEITLKEQPKIPDGVLAPRQKRGLL